MRQGGVFLHSRHNLTAPSNAWHRRPMQQFKKGCLQCERGSMRLDSPGRVAGEIIRHLDCTMPEESGTTVAADKMSS